MIGCLERSIVMRKIKVFVNKIMTSIKKINVKNREILAMILLITISIVIYLIMPYENITKPRIETANVESILEKTDFSEDNKIIINGHNLDNIIKLYVNGDEIKDIEKISNEQVSFI